MSFFQHLEELARLVPGVAGYQDRERARDTDRAVRTKAAGELEAVKRDVERDTRSLADARNLTHLPALDRLGAKLDTLRATIQYASQGYRPVFDRVKLDQTSLERLYTFDLGLFGEIATVRAAAARLHEFRSDEPLLVKAIDDMDQALDRFETIVSGREHLLAQT